MSIVLENEKLYAIIDPKGAELKKLQCKQTGRDILWDANPEFWAKTSPVLFPIVGGLKKDAYRFEDNIYTLPRHGFARDRVFEIETYSEEEATFVLKADAESLKVFPFVFEFRLIYRLDGTSLSCTYAVFNSCEKPMWFSLGGHPAFAVPTSDEIRYSDYFLHFNRDENLRYFPLVGNAIGEESKRIALENGRLPLSRELFYQDALVMKDMKSNEIQLRNTQNDFGINFHFEGFPYFGIWAAKDADFVCLEPWCGLADGIKHDGELIHKEGIHSLEAGAEFRRTWRVEVL
jgi:galactose mutarotase-like enzyme